MNISLLSTSSTGGAGIAALRLHNAFRENSASSHVYIRHLRKFIDDSSTRVNEERAALSRRELRIRTAINQIEKAYISQNRTPLSQTVFDVGLANSLDITQIPGILDSDIVNFHWTSGFAGISEIKTLAQHRRAVAITMHDEWFYTGGCHYTAGCQEYINQCSCNCPQVRSDPMGLVANAFEQKIKVLAMAEPLIITPSVWLAKRARQSRILSSLTCVAIPNPFPVDKLRFTLAHLSSSLSDGIKALLTRSDSDFNILLAAASLDDTRKGFDFSVDILKRLYSSISEIKRARVKVILLGKPSDKLREQIPFATIEVGSVADIADLSAVYSASDVFLNTTREDNYPNVVIESLLCGTPVVAFDIGGIAEQIEPGCGFLIPFGDIESAAFLLDQMIDGDKRLLCRDEVRSSVEAKHSPSRISGLYLDAFNAHLDGGRFARGSSSIDRLKMPRAISVPPSLGLGESNHLATSINPTKDLLLGQADIIDRAKSVLSKYLVLGKEYGPESIEFDMLCGLGWSALESAGRWSMQRHAYMIFPIDQFDSSRTDNDGERTLTFCFKAHSYGDKQRIFVHFMGNIIPVDFTSSPRQATLKLQISDLNTPYITVSFEFPQARRENGGFRLLGIFLHSFRVE